MSMLRPLAITLCALWATITASTVHANPVEAFGIGARSIGMGGAMTAAVKGFAANYYNPAALAADERLRIELGYAYLHPRLTMNDADTGVDAHRGLQVGLVLPAVIEEHTLAFSVSLFLPDNQITRVRALPETQPRFALFDNRPQRLVLTASLGFEILDHLWIGAGLSFLSHTRGYLEVQGEVGFTDPTETDLRTDVDEDLVAIRYPTFALLYEPMHDLRIGVTYREAFHLRLDLEVLVKGAIVDQGQPMIEDASFLLTSFNRTLFSPRQLSVGVMWERGSWRLAVDLTWAQWSQYPTPTSEVEIGLDLPGLPLDLPPPAIPLPPDFHDIFIPRIGTEILAWTGPWLTLHVRAGYAYEPTPVPTQRGRTNFIDCDKHTYATGLGFMFHGMEALLPQPLELDLAFQAVHLPERVTRKADSADVIGDYRAGGVWLGGSATIRLVF